MNKYSEYYYEVIEMYKLFHKNGTKKMSGSWTFAGYSLTKWIMKIKEIIDHSNSSSLIDYGCGKGFLYNNKFRIGNKEYDGLSKLWDINEIFLYDPGVEQYSIYPKKKYDGLICTDVIEHIPENDILSFIDNLFKISKKFVFIVIATIPATKYFDSGENIHLCLKKEKVWKEIFLDFKNKYPEIDQYIYFND